MATSSASIPEFVPETAYEPGKALPVTRPIADTQSQRENVMTALARFSDRWRPQRNKVAMGPIGIDLALNQMHLVQLTSSKNNISVQAHASVNYPLTRSAVFDSDTALTPLLRDALRAGSFSGKKAVVALPAGAFRTMSVSYQLTSGQSEAKTLANLMRDRLDGDLSDYVIDYIPVRTLTRDSERMALVAACPRDTVIRYLNAIQRAGLDVDALEIGPLSIRRLVGALPEMAADDNVVVVNTGTAMTYITVLAGRRLLSDQEFRFGEDVLIGRLTESLNMSPIDARRLVMRTGLEALSRSDQVSQALNESGIFNTLLEIIKPDLMRLVTEIERAVLFTSSETRGGRVSRIYLVGALTRWRGVATALNNILGLEVSNLRAPLGSFNFEDDSGGSPEMVVAAGLALRGLIDD